MVDFGSEDIVPDLASTHFFSGHDGAAFDRVQDDIENDGLTYERIMRGAKKVHAADSGTAYTVDLDNGEVHVVTLTGNVTYTFPEDLGTERAYRFTLYEKQDGDGSRTNTFPNSVVWAGGTEPTWLDGANDVNVSEFITVDGGTTWIGMGPPTPEVEG